MYASFVILLIEFFKIFFEVVKTYALESFWQVLHRCQKCSYLIYALLQANPSEV